MIDDPRVEIKVAPGTTGVRGPLTAEQQKALQAVQQAARRNVESPENTELFDALAKEARATYPGARVTRYLFQAGTDAGAWRSRGVPVYGIYPYPISAQDLERMHGNDERVPVGSLESGVRMIKAALVDVAGK